MNEAIFAGGCFWCTEAAFHEVQGVVELMPGYTGGETKNPTYREVCRGNSGHIEALKVTYNPTEISYEELLDIFWQSIDPTDAGGQFADRGQQYQTAIFYNGEEEKKIAEASKQRIEMQLGQRVATALLPAKSFYAAEEEHRGYHLKNAGHYDRYKHGSGRVARLKELWS